MVQSHDGRCGCGDVRYRLDNNPLFVHCCHCSWCQRETGSAFALNAMIESRYLKVLQGSPEMILTPSSSGKGQTIARCPGCRIALWSHYAGAGKSIAFVRVGSLENPDQFPPDIHIFTSSKLPWVVLSGDVPAVAEYYQRSKFWPRQSQERLQILRSGQAT